jgi:molybdopterin-guanine dinucleotide biosynthesis protein B
MGLPLIHRLGLPVWPFDPPADVMVAEVYPSLLAPAVAREGGIKDAAQVRLLARALWRLAQAGGIGELLNVPEVAREEGWILGAGHSALLESAL